MSDATRRPTPPAGDSVAQATANAYRFQMGLWTPNEPNRDDDVWISPTPDYEELLEQGPSDSQIPQPTQPMHMTNSWGGWGNAPLQQQFYRNWGHQMTAPLVETQPTEITQQRPAVQVRNTNERVRIQNVNFHDDGSGAGPRIVGSVTVWFDEHGTLIIDGNNGQGEHGLSTPEQDPQPKHELPDERKREITLDDE